MCVRVGRAPMGLLMYIEGARINSFYGDSVSACVMRLYPHLGYSGLGVASPSCLQNDFDHSSP